VTTLVYDANTGEGGWPHTNGWMLAYNAWLTAHGIDPNVTQRTEHMVIDAPLIRVHQVAHNADGRCYLDPATGNLARQKPFDVLIRTPAPRPEDYA
jgi:hypothetical protein